MDCNRDKVDEATLALLYLGLTRTPDGGGRTWKGFDQQTLVRLHQKGWIAAPRMREISVEFTPAGVRQAAAACRRLLQDG